MRFYDLLGVSYIKSPIKRMAPKNLTYQFVSTKSENHGIMPKNINDYKRMFKRRLRDLLTPNFKVMIQLKRNTESLIFILILILVNQS